MHQQSYYTPVSSIPSFAAKQATKTNKRYAWIFTVKAWFQHYVSSNIVHHYFTLKSKGTYRYSYVFFGVNVV